MLNQFKNLSCYEEFEIQCALTCISKIDVLKEIGHKIDNYYFFVSNDGIFNWFDFNGNHVKDPGVLKELKTEHIPKTITKCVIPNSIAHIDVDAFYDCESLKEAIIPNSVTNIGINAFYDCKSLKEIIIPNSVISIGNYVFSFCESLEKVVFKGKTLKDIKQMVNYPFGIKDESIIKGN